MKALSRLLSAFLVPALMLSCSALAAQTGTTATAGEEYSIGVDSTTELFLTLTEGTSKSLAFPLTEEQAGRVEKAGADKVTWTLHRTAPYANPADGNFIPLHGEEKMYPNEKETIDFATIRFNDANEYGQAFSMERFETALDGSTLKLDFTTTPVKTGINNSIPHESGGRFLDICGEFTLTAELDGVTLASPTHVTIKPYASFHTMWEMFDELLRLAGEGDDDSATPRPYVEYGVMGKSCLGYDMPYLIVARDSAAVEKWLDLSERAEETGSAVIEELQNSGDNDYQVPVLYSNVHANEVAAADAVVGGCGLDEESLAAVQTGLPYVGFTQNAVEIVRESLLPGLQTGSADGVDCLGYVTYPAETLVNASYIMDGDDVFYAIGTDYFTALPEGAKILVQRDGSRAPLAGVLKGDDESTDAFLNGIMGFSYEGKDKDGNEVNITLFANSMTESGHQRDEYAFISNALFASFLTDTPYVTTAGESASTTTGSN